MEAAGLAVFMISACVFATLLEHPASPLRQILADPLLQDCVRISVGSEDEIRTLAGVLEEWEKTQ